MMIADSVSKWSGQYVVVKFEKDWADEFNVEGFALFTKTEWQKYQDDMNALENLSFYFGTNEGWDSIDGSQFIACMKVSYINKQTYNAIRTVFGKEFGIFPSLEYFMQDVEDF